MNVALPEVDGRVLAGAVSFKTEARFDPATEASVVTYKEVPDRIAFTARLAANWARLARTSAEDRRVALILANYPNRDGRIGNGVGLDTPASTLTLLRAMAEAGYTLGELPADGNAVVRRLAMGPTNDLAARPGADRWRTARPGRLPSLFLPRCPRPRGRGLFKSGAGPRTIRSSPTGISGFRWCASATSPWACSRRGVTTSIPCAPTTTRTWCRRTAIWRSMPGCAANSAPTP